MAGQDCVEPVNVKVIVITPVMTYRANGYHRNSIIRKNKEIQGVTHTIQATVGKHAKKAWLSYKQ